MKSIHPPTAALGFPRVASTTDPVRSRARLVVATVLLALLTAIAAQIKYFPPGSLVPVTLQTLPVVLAGMLLGARAGLASMTLYLLMGFVGFAAFALNLGVGELLGPTGGYLLGFLIAQPVVARIARRRSWTSLISAALAGHAVILLAGGAWLAVLTGSVSGALVTGVLPFVTGSLLKAAAAAAIARGIFANSKRSPLH